ncbi:MAG: DUF11 domain-containing protein [Candidatus Marinimicrobia bacterium]|nr:DUF11 domain-containing protein [Candidatus Neomarinimicrobiota bacterium]MCF7851164.1 DUF11 domain-containing protein [Candidatus Neomarinimicrobiota bacterium]MCF7905489.1 DUF11 domain-containing protein [Candidatus Neomarinimicrobiota bacterium]
MRRIENKISKTFRAARGGQAFTLPNGSCGALQIIATESPLFEGFPVTGYRNSNPIPLMLFARNRREATVTNVTVSGLTAILMRATGMAQMDNSNLSQKEMRVRKTMKRSISKWMHFTIGAILSASMVYAQGTPKLDLAMAEQKVNLTASEMNDASTVAYQPGDTLRYMITAANVGDGLMTEPEVIDPIPTGVTYIANSAVGENTTTTFSIDQGRTYMAWPPTYTVRNAQGELIERVATPDMITHIKWNILRDLNPGDSSNLEFLVEVSK